MNIQKISLRDIVFSGCHGATDREQEVMQRFQISLELTFDASRSIASEKLSDTIDYFTVAALIRKHIENTERKHVLLETLVHEIADDVAGTFICFHVEISIQKPDVPFHPQIYVSKNYFTHRLLPMKSFEEIHQALVLEGATSTPFLIEKEREELLREAGTLDYIRQPELAESGIVREDLSSCTIKSESSMFFAVADRVALFVQELMRVTGQPSAVLPKAHVALQKYETGSFGITPHRDEKKYGLVICILPLTGRGILATCDDREGSNKKPVDTTPGNLVLLRAPGYADMHVRPMHTVYDITEERIVLGVRFPTNE